MLAREDLGKATATTPVNAHGDSCEQSEVQNPTAPQIKPTDTGSSSWVGNYTINISQPAPGSPQLSYSDANYVIDQTFNPGILTVTPAPLTITASDQSEVYGTDTPYAGPGAALDAAMDFHQTEAFTVTSGQLFNGDSVTSVTLFTNPTLSSSSHYNAGTWPITPSAAIFSPPGSSSNYAITYANAPTGFTVDPLPLGMTALSGTNKPYDGTINDPTGSATRNAVLTGDVVSQPIGSASFADPNVGTGKTVTFSYSLSGADAADYALILPTSSTADITPATLVITASSQTQTYGFGGIQYAGTPASLGTTDFTAQVQIPDPADPTDPTKDTYIPMYGSDSVTAVTLSIDDPKLELSSSLNYDAGNWNIVASGATGSGLGNYTIEYPINQTGLTIAKSPLTVTANNESRTYGADDSGVTFGYSITGFIKGDVEDTSEVSGTLNYTHTDGTDSPTEVKQPVGNYAIGISQLAGDPLTYTDTNYTLNGASFVPGTLTITPAPLTIAASNQSQPYGFDTVGAGTSAALTPTDYYTDYYTISSGQLFNGDNVGSVTLSTNDTLSSTHHYNAGTWTLTPSAAAFTSGLSSNYNITYANASTGLTVTPYALTINYGNTVVSAQDKVYNGTTSDIIDDSTGNPITPVLSQLLFPTTDNVVGDKVTLVQGSVNFTNSNVGTWPVIFSGFSLSGADAADYALTLPTSSTTATITKATLVITATPQTQTYGFGGTSAALGTTGFTAKVEIPGINNAPPTFIAMYGSDSITSVTLSTNATSSSSFNYDAGTWTITPSGATGSGLSNYLIDPTTGYIPGSLTINPKPLTVTADNKSQSYGDVIPAFTYAISGFVPGDFLDQSELSGSPDITSTAVDSTSGAGVYAITIQDVGNLAYKDTDYTFTNAPLVGGELTIQTVPLTIIADSQTRVYGTANPSLTYTYTGFVNGETATSLDLTGNPILTGTPSISTIATPTSPVGSYPFTVKIGSLWSSDYTFTLVSGTLSVTPALLTVTSVTATRSYGTTTATTQSFNISGFVPKTTSDVTGTPGVATTTTATSSVGTYPGTPDLGTLESTNYTFAFAGTGTLQVTPALLTVAADSISRFYGLANPVLTATISGYVNGETAATGGVTGSPLFSTTALANSPVGTYPITVQQGTLGATNYTFQTNPGTLTVNTARLIVMADNVTRSFGTPNPQVGWELVREDPPQTPVSAADPDPELTGTPVLSTQAGINSAVGTYPITPAQGTLAVANPNYLLDVSNFQPGTFTITQATLVITANPASRAYGAADPTFTDTISGFINGQTLATSGVTGAPSFTTTASSTSHVGNTYEVVAGIGTLQSADYLFSFIHSWHIDDYPCAPDDHGQQHEPAVRHDTEPERRLHRAG